MKFKIAVFENLSIKLIVFKGGLNKNSCMIIDSNSPVVNETSDKFWNDELINARIMLVEVEKAINTFNTNGSIQSYTIDTGQDKQTVTRAELSSLYNWRNRLLSDIQTLEARLRIGGSRAPQICPGY